MRILVIYGQRIEVKLQTDLEVEETFHCRLLKIDSPSRRNRKNKEKMGK